MGARLFKYLKVWWRLTVSATQIAFVSRFGAVVFLLGKILRFVFFLFFLAVLSMRTKLIGGYNIWQMVFFFLTFNLIDLLPQFFLREVYRFRRHIVTGYFDHYLTKPINVLFRGLFGGSDILDIPMIIIAFIAIFFVLPKLGTINLINIILYISLIANAFLIATAFHVIVLSLGILTTEVDNTIMFYRNLTQMGRVPVDIYTQPLRGLLTFVIPVGIMMTIPTKVLMGIFNPWIILISFFIGILSFLLSLFLWKYALREYSSASS